MPDETVAHRKVRPAPSVDDRLFRLARRERWVVTAEEMASIGMTACAISRRTGRELTRIFHGTYLYGRTVPTPEEHVRAAVKAMRDGQLACRTAGDRWGVLRWRGEIELIVPTDRRRQPGLHPRTRILHSHDVTRRGGLPIRRSLAPISTWLARSRSTDSGAPSMRAMS